MGSPRVGDRVADRPLRVIEPDRSVKSVTLGRLAAERPVLLWFQPHRPARGGRAAWDRSADLAWFAGHRDVRIVGVGGSGESGHSGLGIPTVSDAAGALADAFGVSASGDASTRQPRWTCFLVDASLSVRARWLGEPSAGEIHAHLRRLFDGREERFSLGDPSTA